MKTLVENSRDQKLAKKSQKRTKLEDSTLANSKTYYIPPVIKTVWHLHKDRHTDKWNQIEGSAITLKLTVNLFLACVPRQVNRERIIFSTNDAGKGGYLYS